MRIALLLFCSLLALANGYQAVTGRRLSTRPTRRSEQQIRRESAIGCAFLTILALLVLFGG